MDQQPSNINQTIQKPYPRPTASHHQEWCCGDRDEATPAGVW